MAEQESDRSEPATAFRLQESRKNGTVAKSPDFITLAALFAAVAAIQLFGETLTRRIAGASTRILTDAHHFEPGVSRSWAELFEVVSGAASTLAVIILLVAIFAVLAHVLQFGIVFSTQPLKPDFERLDPASGLSKLIDWRTLFESSRTALKVVLFSAIVSLVMRNEFFRLLPVSGIDSHVYLALALALTAKLLSWLLLGFAIIAGPDVFYRRWDWRDRLRMSRRQFKEELKQREGDPRIRARLRELRKDLLARSQSLDRVKEADVVVTNPTHLAIAIQYKRDEMQAPVVVAKGSGEIASRIREIAFRHRVPVIESRRVARALFAHCREGDIVPTPLFPAIARILAWVYSIKAPAQQESAGLA